MGGRREGQNRYVTGPFDGDCHLPLVLRAVPGDPPRNDLSPFCDEISKDPRIPVVNVQFFIGAETTDLSSQERFLPSVGSRPFSRFLHSLLLSH